MLDSLISSPAIKMLEQTLNFTEQRHNVLIEDISNVDTPGYVQKDVSVDQFQQSLQSALAKTRASNNDAYSPESNDSVEFDANGTDIAVKPANAINSVAFHDRGVRNMEYLMTQLADNAMGHNTVTQLLKNRYDMVTKAISMKP